MSEMKEPLLRVNQLSVSFPDDDPYDGIEERDSVLSSISFELHDGEILGVVGESGSGKSMTALAVIRLLKKTARVDGGEILFDGRSLLTLSEEELCDLRGLGISMISSKAAENYSRENRLLVFSFPEISGRRTLYIATRKHTALPERAQDFLRYLKMFYSDR